MDMSHEPDRSPAMQRGNYAKRCAIIAAATTVFVRDGFTGASIDAIAEEAGVSRQTIYNQIGDKEKLLAETVRGITERSSVVMASTLATFPDRPADIAHELVEFAVRLTRNCICDSNSRALRRLIENEGTRYPELFETWKDYG
ncbi:MAG: TetR/AcrR family transcriptional regulator, partial [Rhizobiaceae bacterium]